ncbi:MAG: RraA family protein [Chloroflexota bacterium]
MVAKLTPDELEALRLIDSPTIANAIEPFKVRPRVSGYMGYDIRCIFPEFGTMLGYAVTCTADSTTESRPRDRSGLMRLWEAVEASPKPAVVVMKDVGNDRLHSCHMGEVMATTAKRLGALGAISDGGLRDVDEVKALGFHYFCPGFTVSHGNSNVVDVGIEVEISGLKIKPGDLLHADVNGVVLIPEEVAARLAEEVGNIRRAEADTMAFVASTEFTLDELRKRFYSH